MSWKKWLPWNWGSKGPAEQRGKPRQSISAEQARDAGMGLEQILDLRLPSQIKASIPPTWFTKKHTWHQRKQFLRRLLKMSDRSMSIALKKWGAEFRWMGWDDNPRKQVQRELRG